MIGSDVSRLVLAVLLAVWHEAPVGVYAVAFAMSLAGVFFNPAASSVLPALVPKQALVAANTGIWTAAVLSQIVLAPFAGLLVVSLGYGPAFAVNAASYAASALLLRGLRVPGRPGKVPRRRLLVEAREGVLVLVRHPLLRTLAVVQFLAALSAGATSALLVVLAREHLGVTGRGYGLLVGAIGVGAALGPLVLLRLVRNPTRPLFVFGPFGLRGLVDVALASTTSVPLAAGALALYGVGTSTGAVTFNSVLPAETPEHVRGRVFASMDVLWQSGRLLSLGLGASWPMCTASRPSTTSEAPSFSWPRPLDWSRPGADRRRRRWGARARSQMPRERCSWVGRASRAGCGLGRAMRTTIVEKAAAAAAAVRADGYPTRGARNVSKYGTTSPA